MLILSRKPGEKILIGNDITVSIRRAKGNRVTVCVDAPPQVKVLRSEIAPREQGPVDPEAEAEAGGVEGLAHSAPAQAE